MVKELLLEAYVEKKLDLSSIVQDIGAERLAPSQRLVVPSYSCQDLKDPIEFLRQIRKKQNQACHDSLTVERWRRSYPSTEHPNEPTLFAHVSAHDHDRQHLEFQFVSCRRECLLKYGC